MPFWLAGGLAGELAGWLPGCLAGWLAGWLVAGWLAGGWLVAGWLAGASRKGFPFKKIIETAPKARLNSEGARLTADI